MHSEPTSPPANSRRYPTRTLQTAEDLPFFDITTSDQNPVHNDDFDFNVHVADCDPWPPEFDTAQVNVFLGVEGTHDWFKDLQPNVSAIDRNIPCCVNYSGSEIPICNAGYIGGAEALAFSRAEAGCNNFAIRSVIAHEYGHFILDQIVGAAFGPFHEGTADTVASLAWDSPLNGFDALRDNEPLRDIDDDLPLTGGPCGGNIHCRGVALAGAFWDLREEFNCCEGASAGTCAMPLTECTLQGAECGAATCIEKKGLRCCEDGAAPGRCASPVTACIDSSECAGGAACIDRPTEELFADFLLMTFGVLEQSVLTEVLIADDDDGNLTSDPPTPHYDQIIHAFANLHGWEPDISCTPPVTGVIVKWLGPPPGTDPQPDEDYFVDYLLHGAACLPHVTLVTTEKGDPDAVRVRKWFVGRVHPTTEDPLDLGAVVANWIGDPHDLEAVEVGTDPEAPCRDVDVVEIPAQSPQHWSSIVLQLGGVCDAASGVFQGDPCDRDVDCCVECEGFDGACSLGDMQRTCFGIVDSDRENCNSESQCTLQSPNYTVCASGHLRVRAHAYAVTAGTCDGGANNDGPCDPEGDPAQECPGGGACDDARLGMGGRIKGTLAGVGHRVYAEAIGVGDGEAPGTGALRFKRGFNRMALRTVPSGRAVFTEAIGVESLKAGYLKLRGELHGEVTIAGELDRVVEVLGTGLTDGNITITGNLTGEVNIAGELDGTINVVGGVDGGRITVSGTGVSGGDILVEGNIEPSGQIVITGTLDGDICAANLPPGGPLPTNVSVGQFGDTGTICGTRLGMAPPNQPSGAEGVLKNRYLSFVPGFPGAGRKFRVTLVGLPVPFDYLNGQKMWVGAPAEICENSGQDSHVPPQDCGYAGGVPNLTFWGAELVCDYANAASIDGATVSVVHIYDDEIVPGGIYEVQAFPDGGDYLDENDFSVPFGIITAIAWGDVCGPGYGGTACMASPDLVVDVTNDVLV